MDAAIVTFTHKPALYEISSQMLDLPFPKFAFRNYTTDWNEWFRIFLQVPARWLILVDEDVFVFDPKQLELLLEFLELEGITICGVPDGGVVEHRFHNPIICNPFFCVFDRSAIPNPTDTIIRSILQTPWDDSYRDQQAPFVGTDGKQFAYDHFEPWYGFQFWLCHQGFKFHYLDAIPWQGEPERCTTLLKSHIGKLFALHTWFARHYDGSHRDRIDRAMKYALSLRDSAAF